MSLKVIADFSILPIGHGETSIGRYVAAAISAMNKVNEARDYAYGNGYGGRQLGDNT
ncbi:MAG: hypothetical protein QXL10_00660 [Candidatus Bathyarchaeia archaeon]